MPSTQNSPANKQEGKREPWYMTKIRDLEDQLAEKPQNAESIVDFSAFRFFLAGAPLCAVRIATACLATVQGVARWSKVPKSEYEEGKHLWNGRIEEDRLILTVERDQVKVAEAKDIFDKATYRLGSILNTIKSIDRDSKHETNEDILDTLRGRRQDLESEQSLLSKVQNDSQTVLDSAVVQEFVFKLEECE